MHESGWEYGWEMVRVTGVCAVKVPEEPPAERPSEHVVSQEPLIHLEWPTRPHNITEPAQVEMCRQAFSHLLSASVTGAGARQLIAAADGLRPA